jgi:hypothetical protein
MWEQDVTGVTAGDRACNTASVPHVCVIIIAERVG